MIKNTFLITLIISLKIVSIYQLTVQVSARSIDKLRYTTDNVLTQLSLSRRREHQHLEFIQNQSYMDSVAEEAVNPGHELNGRLKLSRQDENLEVKEGVLVPIEMAFTYMSKYIIIYIYRYIEVSWKSKIKKETGQCKQKIKGFLKNKIVTLS